MSKRSRAREVVLQVLYQEDLNPHMLPHAGDEFLQRRLRTSDLVEFARSLLKGVRQNRNHVDELLGGAAENWTLKRMAATDRNVLRLGAYEILFTDTPDRVAINEAVDLAKRFGSMHSGQFVNGILDRFLASSKQ